jgi:UDP-glucuronate 4-epimerase
VRDSPILVTGAAGMVGRRLVDRLRQDGRAVIACDRVVPPDPTDFETVIAELGDVDRLHTIAAEGVDGIIHCGGISGPMVAPDDPARIARVNIGGTVNLLEIARLLRLRRFVYCSSVSAYGDTPPGRDPVDADAPLAATDIYGASKAAGDLMVRAYARQHGLDAAALRIGFVYGPRRRTSSFLARALRDALDGRPTVLEVDGEQAMQMVHVEDVAAALVAAYDAPDLGSRAFNVTGGTRVPLRELARLVRERVPGAQIVFGTLPDRENYRQARFDIDATLRVLRWTPRFGLAEGIAQYADWLSEHPY